MPIVALAVEKSLQFQGARETFSNVYTLDSGTADLSDDWSGTANAVADLEKATSITAVRFDAYRVWNLEGSKLDRVIIDAGDLEGYGTNGGAGGYRECAVMIRWPLSRSPVLRRRRWLTKWLHGCSLGGSATQDVLAGVDQIPESAIEQILDNYARPLLGILGVDGTRFTDGSGEQPGDPFVKPYLEHRQFHHG